MAITPYTGDRSHRRVVIIVLPFRHSIGCGEERGSGNYTAVMNDEQIINRLKIYTFLHSPSSPAQIFINRAISATRRRQLQPQNPFPSLKEMDWISKAVYKPVSVFYL